jgi:hypothetical protein
MAIPILLLAGLLATLLLLQQSCDSHDNGPFAQCTNSESKCVGSTLGLVAGSMNAFMFGWIIAGSVWVWGDFTWPGADCEYVRKAGSVWYVRGGRPRP